MYHELETLDAVLPFKVHVARKYAFEAMRLITCVKALYTKRMAFRITHGQFVNVRGGAGNNYANDLRMEMMVKDDKGILKGMCGNKTLKAVDRSTSSADGLKKVVHCGGTVRVVSLQIQHDIPQPAHKRQWKR